MVRRSVTERRYSKYSVEVFSKRNLRRRREKKFIERIQDYDNEKAEKIKMYKEVWKLAGGGIAVVIRI
jgi:hypothetical protein